MSNYINSFLIEPVVRQARRFSRPSNDDITSQPAGRQLTAEDQAEIHQGEAGPPVMMTWGRSGGLRTPAAAVSSTSESDTFAPDSDDAALWTWSDQQQDTAPLRQSEVPLDEDSALSDTTNNPSSDDLVSSNPVYGGVPESLGSTTSSLSSAQVTMDPGTRVTQHSARATRRTSHDDDVHSYEKRSRRLPADDGMSSMRKRITAIQRTDSSSSEKARMIHDLMTEQYNSSQSSLYASHPFRARSPASLASHERPTTPASLRSMDNSLQCTSPPTSLSSVAEASNSFNPTFEDLKPTFYGKPTSNQPTAATGDRSTDRLSDASGEDTRPLGCPHYKRNIKLQCSACYRWYTCRFCHDEVEDHSLNRRETKNMLCMLCGCAQSASEECSRCGERSARYYCSVCKLWDDDPGKSIYHCNDCGICRIGQGLGKDFYHCKTCCVCLSIGIRETHRCIERSTDCDCPICGEYMFTSPQTVVFMGCGHSIHHRCYYEHMKRSYRCPICSRSIINMEMQFRHLERAIESQPMPPEFQDTKAWVYCNDCNVKSSVKYHWLGLKCGVCDSYNTAQLQMIHGSNQGNLPDESAQAIPNLHARGRASDTAAQTQRTTNSAPPSAGVLPPERPDESLRRNTHSQEPHQMAHLPLSPDSMDAYSDDDDEEYSDDVDFWGLGSTSPRPQTVLRDPVPSGSSSEDEDDSDEDMSDDPTEEEEEDQMEIFGHR
ncbi:MAG: hypothetical protein LQ343_006788 [Gyalolechia ehrenbergii]|nr:MAG: hypothetical protein LQ343_006788 [Gyalolechia ehrenbergii]